MNFDPAINLRGDASISIVNNSDIFLGCNIFLCNLVQSLCNDIEYNTSVSYIARL